jgi:hypothetical protein
MHRTHHLYTDKTGGILEKVGPIEPSPSEQMNLMTLGQKGVEVS